MWLQGMQLLTASFRHPAIIAQKYTNLINNCLRHMQQVAANVRQAPVTCTRNGAMWSTFSSVQIYYSRTRCADESAEKIPILMPPGRSGVRPLEAALKLVGGSELPASLLPQLQQPLAEPCCPRRTPSICCIPFRV